MILMFAYLILTSAATLIVGHTLFNNGLHYLLMLFTADIAHSLNKLLLTGYYLLIIGLIVFTGATWPAFDNIASFIAALSTKTGEMLLVIGIIHAFNVAALAAFSFYKKQNRIQ